MDAEKISSKIIWFFNKTKYYLFVLVAVIIAFISGYYANINFSGVKSQDLRILSMKASFVEYWWEILIGALLLTIVVYLVIQYKLISSMKNLKDEDKNRKERAEIHNMRYGVRR